MKKLILITLLFVIAGEARTQKKDLTLEDAFLKVAALSPESMKLLQWIPGTTKYCWVKKSEGKDALVSADAASGTEETTLTIDKLNQLLKESDQKELQAFPKVKFIDANSFWFDCNSGISLYSISDKKLERKVKWSDEAENIDISEKYNVAYTLGRELFVSKPGSPDKAITSGTPEGSLNGAAAYRNEFGITKGTFWSSDATHLAWYAMDESMVTTYPVMDLTVKPAGANMIRYPMAGQTSHIATVMMINLETNKTVAINSEKVDHYLTNITWSPDNKFLYIAELNRDQNHLWLNQYDANTGNLVKTLFEEQSTKYVEPEHGPQFLPTIPNEFLWISEKEGFDQIYLYQTDGKFLRKLCEGETVVTEILGFDEKVTTVYYIGTANNALERQVFAVDIKSGKVRKISLEAGTHGGIVHPSGKYILDIYTSGKVPRDTRLIDGSGKVVRTLLSSKNPVADYNMGETRLVSLKSDDGTALNGRMILPPGFDPSKKYPVIVYVYGGPHLQMINDTWLNGGGLWMHYAAEKGYIIFSLDNRGSSNRGAAFEQAVFRNLGTEELKDQMKGVEYLKSQAFVDGNRMGIFGWSFGGFMTTSFMLRYPDVFKVAVAGGPVMDWAMYEIMYTERYMDTPQTNPEGYAASSLLTKVKNLKGKLMLIHGTSDDVVLWQHSLLFIQECVSNGVQLDYFVYPGHQHNVFGKDRVHLYNKVLEYFFTGLK